MVSKTFQLRVISCLVLTSYVHSYPSVAIEDISASSESAGDETFAGDFGAKINTPRDYQFAYEIRDDKTTNFQKRVEVSENGYLQGSYSHLAPDGVVRTVVYSDDGTTGYQVMLHEIPTNITVIGSGLPGDPLLGGKISSAQTQDFHSLLNLLNLNGKFGDKKGTKFGFPALGNSRNSKNLLMPEKFEGPIDDDHSLESSLGGTSSETISASGDEEFDAPSSFGSKVKSAIVSASVNTISEPSNLSSSQVKTEISNYIAQNEEPSGDAEAFKRFELPNSVSDDAESAVFVSKDSINSISNLKNDKLFQLKQEPLDETSKSDGGIPVVVLDQVFLKSLEAKGPMSTQTLVQAIQQAMQSAISTNKESNTYFHKKIPDEATRNVQSSKMLEDAKNIALESVIRHGATPTAGTQPLGPQAHSVPIIVLDKKVFDSLDKPGSSMTKQQLALGIQQALYAAIETTSSNQIESVQLSTSDNSEYVKYDSEEQESSGKPSSTDDDSQFLGVPVNQVTDAEHSDSSSHLGGIPVIALDAAVFQSLDRQGSKMTKDQLIQAIQNALKLAVEQNTSEAKENLHESLGRIKEDSHSKQEDSLNSSNSFTKSTSALKVNQKEFDPLQIPGSTMTRKQIVEAFQHAMQSAMDSISNDVDDDKEEFKQSDNSNSNKIDSLWKENSGMATTGHVSQSGSLTPVIAIDRRLFDSADDSKKQELVNSIQRALHSAIESTASAKMHQGDDSNEQDESAEKITIHSEIPITLESTAKTNEAGAATFTVVQDNGDSDDISNSDDDTSIITLNHDFFQSLKAPESPMTGQQLVLAMQKALSSAQKNSESLEGKEGKNDPQQFSSETLLVSDSESLSESSFNSESEGVNSNLEGGIPVVVLDQAKFESLDVPGSTMTRQQLVQAIQDALNMAVKISPSTEKGGVHGALKSKNSMGKSLTNQLPIKFESNDKSLNADVTSFSVVHENDFVSNSDGGIPVVALDRKFFESVGNSGSNMNGHHPILSAMQQALHSALKGSTTNTEQQIGGVSTDGNKPQNSGEPQSLNLNRVSSASRNSQAGVIPFIALDQAVFESLGVPGSTMNRQQLVEAIQQSLDTAIKSTGTNELHTENGLQNRFAHMTNDENKFDSSVPSPNAQDAAAQESNKKQTAILLSNPAGVGFQSFANNMNDFIAMHNRMVKPISKTDQS